MIERLLVKYCEDDRNAEKELRLWVSPLAYYISKYRVIFNSAIVNPERYLTVLGIVIGFLGFLSLLFDESTLFKLIAILVFMLAVVTAPLLALLLTRPNAKEFTSIIGNPSISNKEFINYAAYEAHRIAEYIYRYSQDEYITQYGPRKIQDCIGTMQESIMIIEEVKSELAKRLKVNKRAISDDFLRFSPSIYINRHLKLSDLLNDELGIGPTGIEKVQKNRAKCIQESSKKTIEHLKILRSLDADLDYLGLMFQTRSLSGATQHFIKFLWYESQKSNLDSLGKILAVVEMQKAYKTGVVAHRVIGLAITYYLSQLNMPDSHVEKEKKLALRRIRCVSEQFLQKEINDEQSPYTASFLLSSFDGWIKDLTRFIRAQRDEIKDEFKVLFKSKYDQHCHKRPEGKLYVLLSSYSRAIRAVFREVILKDYADKIHIVVCYPDKRRADFSSRLMYHQMLEELYEFSEDPENIDRPGNIENCESLKNHAWRSSFSSLESRVDKEKDSVIFVGGCEEINFVKNVNTGRLDIVAYTGKPMSMLDNLTNMLNERNSGDTSDETSERDDYNPLSAVIVAGEYKFGNSALLQHLDKDFKEDIEELLPKPRRAELYKWESKPKLDLRVVTSKQSVQR
jgi:hypothetical protein